MSCCVQRKVQLAGRAAAQTVVAQVIGWRHLSNATTTTTTTTTNNNNDSSSNTTIHSNDDKGG